MEVPFGDELRPEEEAMTRISSLDISGIPLVNSHPKNQEIRTFIRLYKIDIMGMAEMNVNWTHVNNGNWLHE